MPSPKDPSDVSRDTSGIVRRQPSWALRGIAVVGVGLAGYLVSPWFVPVSRQPLLDSPLGRWLCFVGIVALSLLLWAVSTRSDTRARGRWYHNWPYDRRNR
jgi:hypothetical protein